MSKTILIDIRSIIRKPYSGVGKYTFNLLDTLFKVDQKNQYFLYYNNYKGVELPDWNYKNVKFIHHNWPNKIFNISHKYLNIPKISKLLPYDIDIFFMPNLNFISKKLFNNFVLTIHDLSFELYPEFFTKKTILWHKLINPKQLCQNASLILAVSNNTKKDLIDLYSIPENKIKVLYPGIEHNKYNYEEKEIEEFKLKNNLTKPFFLSLGNMEPRKNLLGMLNMFSEFIKKYKEEYDLVITGADGWLNKEIYKYINNSNIKDNIKILNYVTDKEKQILYQLAKCFVFTSFYEGFGFPPLESLAANTPVVAGNNSSLAEVLPKENTLFIDPYNISQGAWALKQSLLINKDDEVAKNVKNMYTWESYVLELVKVWQEL